MILVMPNCLSGAERHGEDDGGAVRIGDDLPFPAAGALLAGDQLQVIGIDFGHEQRHVAIHAVVARIGDHDVAGLGEGLFDFGGDGGIHGGEQQLRRVAGLGSSTVSGRDGSGVRRRDATSWLRVFLAGGAVAGAEPREVEQRMTVEKFDEMLAHHSGGAEDAYFDSFHA
jgi:hypothetical protein